MARGSGLGVGLDQQCGVSMSSLNSTPALQFSRREALRCVLGGGLLAAGGANLPLPAGGVPAKAKAGCQCGMWGGPSPRDSRDPKPAAGYDYCGPGENPIPTRTEGGLI